jgi:hypothetical protein
MTDKMKISFKTFISEETIKLKPWEEADVEERAALEEINKHCTDALRALSTGAVLFRGISQQAKFRKVDPSTGLRTSRDTNNIYQLMFDSADDFSSYPKRSKSMICTNDNQLASVYGEVHLVLPYNGTKLAIGSNVDFIRQKISAPILGTGNTILLMRLGKFIAHFLTSLDIGAEAESVSSEGNQKKFTSMQNIDSALSKFDPITLTVVWNEKLSEVFAYQLFTYDSIPNEIRTALYDIRHGIKTIKPEKNVIDVITKNGFKSVAANIFYKMMRDNPSGRMTAITNYLFTQKRITLKLEDYSNYVDSGGVTGEREIWFSGPAILVGMDEAKKLVKSLDYDNNINTKVKKLFNI